MVRVSSDCGEVLANSFRIQTNLTTGVSHILKVTAYSRRNNDYVESTVAMECREILDRDHLARYTMGDTALEQEVLGLFIGQVPETVTMLRNSGDAEAWMRAAHTIKGSARAVGAWKLADAAERAENRCRQQERWQALADDIEAAVAEVRLCIVTNK